jgi:hypothetical protein
MRYAIEKLIDDTKRDLESIKSEINELSCETNPHPDDVVLCEKLNIKYMCYKNFHKKLTTISLDDVNDL